MKLVFTGRECKYNILEWLRIGFSSIKIDF